MNIIKKILAILLGTKTPKRRRVVKKPQRSEASLKNDSGYQIYRTLPFKNRRMNFGHWIYRNKIGVTALVVSTLSLFFIFVTVRFQITPVEIVNGFFVEAPPEEPEEPEEEQKQELTEQQMEQQMYESIRNAASNSDSKLDAALKDDRGTQANDLYKEAQELQDRLKASQDSYNKGLEEAEAIGNKKDKNNESQDEDASRKDVKIDGLVTVDYKLDGRNATNLPVPAYKCENAGRVVVDIVVDNNGNVVEASINTTSSKKDDCLNETAISFAKKSRFEIGTDWPKKHKGTITYMFLQQ